MRQSEYTTFYERRGNVKFPVRGKLFMRHRGMSIYVRNGVLTMGVTGTKIPDDVAAGCNRKNVADYIDQHWELLLGSFVVLRKHQRITWRSWQGGSYRVNGRVIPKSAAVKCIPY